MLYFRCWQLRAGGSRGERFHRQNWGGGKATCRNSTSIIFITVIFSWHRWSDQHHLVDLGTVPLQFWGALIPFFLGPFSELWQLTSWVQSDHQVVNFSTWYFGVYKTAHRMWLRILSITLEKELKSSLTVLNSCVIIIQSPLALFLCFHISLIKLIL